MSTKSIVLIVVTVLVAFLLFVIGGTVFLVRHFRPLAETMLGRHDFRGQPLPSGDKVITEKQLEPLWRGYYRKNFGAAYEQHGKHDPRWDKAATAYLEAQAILATGMANEHTYRELIEPGQGLLKQGCDDPLVMLITGNALFRSGFLKESQPLLERAVPGLKARGYPPLTLAWAYTDLAVLNHEAGRHLNTSRLQWRPLAIDAYVAAAGQRNFGPQEHRLVMWEMGRLMEGAFRQFQAEVTAALKKQPATDPWILHMICGHESNQIAWTYRGHGFISQVPPDNLKQFEAHERAARDHFEQAYKLHPEYPDAALALINIAKTGATGMATSPRVWFDRAVAAEFDWLQAYYAYLGALQPRWGGTHEAMLDFARECVNTGRFDTRVPSMAFETVQMIAEDDREESVWQDPKVWPMLQQYSAGKVAWTLKNRPESIKPLRTVCLILAWRCGHPEAAREQLDAMRGKVDELGFRTYWSERPELLVGAIYGLTGPHKEQVTRAENLYAAEKTDQALAAFQALLQVTTDKPTLYYLRDRLQSLQWEQQFQAGQWVDLKPTPDGVGWDILRGRYEPLPDGTGFTMWPAARDGIMVCMVRPGRSFEIRCEAEFPEETVRGIEAGFVVDLPLTAKPYFDTLRIIRDPPHATFGPGWSPYREPSLPAVPRRCRLRAVQRDTFVTLYLDDQPVIENMPLCNRYFRSQSPHHVAIGGEVWPDAKKPVIYRHIQIHKLSGDAAKS